jgi:hypothetical protein
MANLIAAPGNDGVGMAGLMWRAHLRLYESHGNFDAAKVLDQAADSARIVSLSLGADFYAEDSVQRRKADAWRVPLAAELAARSILQQPLPLLVIAAGDDREDADLSGPAGLNLPFTVVVGGSEPPSSSGWHRWGYLGTGRGRNAGSNFGDRVDVYAPGRLVTVWSSRLSSFSSWDGTSISAPIVAGIAGLLLSFDPSLSSAQLKQLLIDGAAAGNRPIVEHSGKYLANAYESLKLAAQRHGAPLCGSRLFVNAGGGLVVERANENDLETIWPSGVDPSPWTLEPFHGGRRVGVYLNNTTGDGFRDLVLNNSTWSAVTLPTIEPDPASGSWFSAIGITHDGDSTAIVDAEDVPCILSGPDPYRSWCFSPSGNYQQTLSLGDLLDYPTPGRILGQKPRAITGASGWQPIRQSRNDGTPWQTADSVPTVAGVTGFPQVYPSASSDRVYLVMSRTTATVDAFGEWRPCSDQVPSPNCQKRDFLWHSKSLSASVYAVPWAGGNVDSLWSVSDSAIGGLGTSEDGRELANTRQRAETIMWLTYDSYVDPRVVSQAYGSASSYVSPLTGALIRSYPNLGPDTFGTMSAVKKGNQSALMLPRRPSDDRVLRPPGWAALPRRLGIRPRN